MRSIVLLPALLGALFAQAQAPSPKEVKARAFLQNNKPYKAIGICDGQLGRTVHPEFYVIRADARNRIGEHLSAERDARSAIAAFPANVEGIFQLGVAEQGMGRWDSAGVHLERALRAMPSPEVRLKYAMNLQSRGLYDQAIAQLDNALAAETAHDDNSARFYRVKGESLALKGDSSGAHAAFDEALRLSPDDPVNLNDRAWYLFARNGDHQRAIRDYDRAIKLNPNYSYVFNNRGWSWYKLGNKEKALKDIRLAQRKKVFNPMVYRNLGVIALESGDKVAACTQFRRALDYDFTALYGSEVSELISANCGQETNGKSPVQAPNAPMDRPDQKPPVRSNAP